jgi:sterol desaturase/sphingolipid hydroxylase (fatty acid hydroxylase superfamily)
MSLQTLFASHFENYNEEDIVHDQTPIRLFKSDVLEWFTHVSPLAVIVLFGPVVIGSLVVAALNWQGPPLALALPLMFVLGFAIWTLTEYLVHRFFFHFEPKSIWGKRLIFLFHGVHHVQPHIKTRLVMPPAVSIPGGALFFWLFSLVFSSLGYPALMLPTFAGFTLGYIAYDLLHYAEHHLPMKGKVLKFLKRHHMEHHYKTPQARFGVSTNLWDEVFHTEPQRS